MKSQSKALDAEKQSAPTLAIHHNWLTQSLETNCLGLNAGSVSQWLCDLEHYSTSLCLSSLICQMRIIIARISWGYCELNESMLLKCLKQCLPQEAYMCFLLFCFEVCLPIVSLYFLACAHHVSSQTRDQSLSPSFPHIKIPPIPQSSALILLSLSTLPFSF